MRCAPATSTASRMWKRQVVRRHQPAPQFARMQRDGTSFARKPIISMWRAIVLARHAIVLRPDEIEPGDARVRADQRGRERGLHEHVGFVGVAVDLRDVA